MLERRDLEVVEAVVAPQWSIEYSLVLDPMSEDTMRVRIRTDRDAVVDFVVQYETVIDDRVAPVVRYDASHGRAHRDVLDERGQTIAGGKLWLPEELDQGRVIEFARRDILRNWRRYRADFIRRSRRHE